jgi:hypothetical protein
MSYDLLINIKNGSRITHKLYSRHFYGKKTEIPKPISYHSFSCGKISSK